MTYPPIEPNATFKLDIDDIHSIFAEECGNPEGIPVVFLHGGPGSGCSPAHRRFFDPAAYRIILFDQRGAGRSTPHGCIERNTTADLVADIERLRTHLGIHRWLVFGGSWGSTLALAYAVAHPAQVLGLVLRGVFLGRPQETDWFMQGMRQVFPEHWERWVGYLPEAQRGDPCTHYYRLLTNPDPAIHLPAARHWASYEGACSTLRPNADVVAGFAADAVALSLARIEAHYFTNDFFMPPGHLLDNVNRLRHLPCIIVQGRYDIVCPFISAWELSQAWPEASLRVIDDAGHSAFEPGTQAALVAATDEMKVRLVAV